MTGGNLPREQTDWLVDLDWNNILKCMKWNNHWWIQDKACILAALSTSLRNCTILDQQSFAFQ